MFLIIRITSDKQLQCTLCNVIVKNEIAWIKHSKLEEHLNAIKYFKEKTIKGITKPKVETEIIAKTIELLPMIVEDIKKSEIVIDKDDTFKNPKNLDSNFKSKILSMLAETKTETNNLPEVNLYKIKSNNILELL